LRPTLNDTKKNDHENPAVSVLLVNSPGSQKGSKRDNGDYHPKLNQVKQIVRRPVLDQMQPCKLEESIPMEIEGENGQEGIPIIPCIESDDLLS